MCADNSRFFNRTFSPNFLTEPFNRTNEQFNTTNTMITLEQFRKNLKNLGLIILSQICAAIFMFALYLLTLIF